MICPRCESEHEPTIRVCPECDLPLVAEVAEVDHRNQFVEVFATSDADLLPFVESLLRDEGIAYTLEGDEAMGIMPVAGSGLATRVLVPADRREEAEQLLARAR